jgi:hypothetical protein
MENGTAFTQSAGGRPEVHGGESHEENVDMQSEEMKLIFICYVTKSATLPLTLL